MEKKYIITHGLLGIIILTNVNPNCGKCIEHGIRIPHIIETQSPINPGRSIYAVGETSMAIISSTSASPIYFSDSTIY